MVNDRLVKRPAALARYSRSSKSPETEKKPTEGVGISQVVCVPAFVMGC